MIGECGVWSKWNVTKCSDFECYVLGQGKPRRMQTRRCYSKLTGQDMDNCEGLSRMIFGECDNVPPCNVPYMGQENCTAMPGEGMDQVFSNFCYVLSLLFPIFLKEPLDCKYRTGYNYLDS